MPKEDWKFTGKFEKNTGENQENAFTNSDLKKGLD